MYENLGLIYKNLIQGKEENNYGTFRTLDKNGAHTWNQIKSDDFDVKLGKNKRIYKKNNIDILHEK